MSLNPFYFLVRRQETTQPPMLKYLPAVVAATDESGKPMGDLQFSQNAPHVISKSGTVDGEPVEVLAVVAIVKKVGEPTGEAKKESRGKSWL